jgi:gas vesicle protein
MKFFLALFGCAVGVGLGMMFAPAPGEETRAQLAGKVREITSFPERRMQEKVEEVAAGAEDKAGDIGSRVGRQVAETAVKAVTDELVRDRKDKTA